MGFSGLGKTQIFPNNLWLSARPSVKSKSDSSFLLELILYNLILFIRQISFIGVKVYIQVSLWTALFLNPLHPHSLTSCRVSVPDPIGSGFFPWIRIRFSNFSRSGSGFQICLDPDSVFKFLCIRIRIQYSNPWAKECRKGSKSYLLELDYGPSKN